MKRYMITTNLRLDSYDLAQYKTIAAELGLSFNEFVTRVLAISITHADVINRVTHKEEPLNIWDLAKMAQPFKSSAEADWNEDDRIVYDQ